LIVLGDFSEVSQFDRSQDSWLSESKVSQKRKIYTGSN